MSFICKSNVITQTYRCLFTATHVERCRVLPNVTISSRCYLEMKDDSGKAFASPAFSYLREYSDALPAVPARLTLPVTQGSVEANVDPPGLDAEAMAVPDPSPAVASALLSARPNPLQSSAAPSSATSQAALSLEDSRIPTPVAAYAVPLSLVSTILVAASGLAIRQCRKLRAERLREQESLEARRIRTLPGSGGHSAFDPVGLGLSVLTLGNGPALPSRSVAGALRSQRQGPGQGPGSARSASASMSRMRAWRRGVSPHESGSHPHGLPPPDDADEKTYVARSDDGHSTISSKACPPKSSQPRHPSRVPFYASTGASRSQPRRTTVPASMFRESPIGVPYPHDGIGDEGLHHHSSRESKYATYGRRRYIEEEEEEHGQLQWRDRGRGAHSRASEDYQDATTHLGDVMARDVDLFPIPLSPAQPLREQASISHQERTYDGRYIQGAPDFGKAPVPTRFEGANGSIYDVVAKKVSRGDMV